MRILQAVFLAVLGVAGVGYTMLSFESISVGRQQLLEDVSGFDGLVGAALVPLTWVGLLLFLAVVGFLALSYLLVGADEGGEE